MKPNCSILFSVNTQLAYQINQNFYGKHFVWCAPVFDCKKVDSLSIYRNIPPSSNPQTIYDRYKQDVEGGDLHSASITQNRAGLKNGAILMLNNGIIDTLDLARINKMIDCALIQSFLPIIYLIPMKDVDSRLKIVDVDKMANPLSVEYQIPDLKTHEFQTISGI